MAPLVTPETNGETHKSLTRLCPSLSKLHLLPPCLLPEEVQVSIISFPNYQPWEKPPKETWVKVAATVLDALEGKGQSPLRLSGACRDTVGGSHEPSLQPCPASLQGHETYHLMAE